jgi:cation/acetate symporter
MITDNPIPQLGFIGNIKGEDISMLQKLDETVKGLGFESYLSSTKTSFDIFCITPRLPLTRKRNGFWHFP